MISFALIHVIILILIILITNNKKLTKFFNFVDITDKNIKYKLYFYTSLYILLKIKKILYLVLIFYLLFNIYHLYKILNTYKTTEVKPLITNLNNPLYLISLISFLSIYNILSNKNNTHILIISIIKIIPNILISVSILLYKINIFITEILYNKYNKHKIKKYTYETIHIYYKIYYKTKFYGMKEINKLILKQIKDINTEKNINNIELYKLASINKKGDIVIHPTNIWYIADLIYTNTITHNPISIKIDPLKINNNSYSEAVWVKKSNLIVMDSQYEEKLFKNLNIDSSEKYNEYKKNLLEYNDYIFKSNKDIINQTSSKKYININEVLEKSLTENINKPITIDIKTQKLYENIFKKDEKLYNYYHNLKNTEKITFLLNLKEEAFNIIE